MQVSDATFEAIREFYPIFSNLHPVSSVQAELIAERSTRATDVFVVSSQWAIDSLVRDYAVGTHQCILAPTGPGIEPTVVPTGRESSSQTLHALLVSSDWHRKGGDVAVEAVRRARARGTEVVLTVVGDAPSGLPEWARSRGRLDALSVDDLAEGAADALTRFGDPAFRSRLGEAARARWASDLNWDEWARRTLSACVQAWQEREAMRR